MSNEPQVRHFRVGDSVLVTQPPLYNGRVGVVDTVDVHPEPNPYFVRFPDTQTYGWFGKQHLELAETSGEHVQDKLADDPYAEVYYPATQRPVTPADVLLGLGIIALIVGLFVFFVLFYR